MRVIRSVMFEADVVAVQYMDDTDVRLGGMVFATHQLSVGRGGEHDDEIRAVEEAAQDLLRDVLEDFDSSLPYDPRVPAGDEDDDDDDD